MCPIVIEDRIRIPANVNTLEAYRAWAHSDEFPDRGHFFFIDDELWIDMSPEQLFTHNQVKGEFERVLRHWARQTGLGRYFGDGALTTNEAANLSTEPDGVYISRESVRSGRIEIVNNQDGPLELVGAPDMVLEVISKSSVRKDTTILRELYWNAGVREYWLVDARGAEPTFTLLAHGPNGYEPASTVAGWVSSNVFGRQFRLEMIEDEMGPDYKLLIQ